MKNILAGQNRPVLERFASSNVLVAFDYDGTLAPIVSDPASATMRDATRELLEDLSKLYPCIVISGRAQDDVLKRLRGTGVREAIGNHGVEPWHGSNPLLQEVQRWLPTLETHLSHYKGVVIENKLFSIAIHYRRSPERRIAHAAITRAVRGLGEVRVIGGKLVVNVLPQGTPHKGVALERARERFRCDTAVYVGDDDTDEDVFGLDQPDRVLTIRVGAKRGSLADYCIPNQSEIDTLIRQLLDLRKQHPERQEFLVGN